MEQDDDRLSEQNCEKDIAMEKVFMMYIIGMSGSGKTTIANALLEKLRARGKQRIQVIDGDIIRKQFGDIFGNTYEERMKCNRAVRVVADYLIDNQVSVILAQVAAYREMRRKVREQFAEHYIEVYVKCSPEECARRDVKGYYRKYQLGEIHNLNGMDDVYEVPEEYDILVDTERETVEECVQKIADYLEEKGYVL